MTTKRLSDGRVLLESRSRFRWTSLVLLLLALGVTVLRLIRLHAVCSCNDPTRTHMAQMIAARLVSVFSAVCE